MNAEKKSVKETNFNSNFPRKVIAATMPLVRIFPFSNIKS